MLGSLSWFILNVYGKGREEELIIASCEPHERISSVYSGRHVGLIYLTQTLLIRTFQMQTIIEDNYFNNVI